MNTETPLIDFAPTAFNTILKCQNVLAEYIVPDSNISDSECINRLLEILDDQNLVKKMKEILPIKSEKKIIKHARDIYEHCSGEFASGVHLYLEGKGCPARPCSDDLIQGWICAQRDLQDSYELVY